MTKTKVPAYAKACMGCKEQVPLNKWSALCRPCEKEVGLRVEGVDYTWQRGELVTEEPNDN